MLTTNLKSVFNKFKASGTWQNASAKGSGHIHSTWLIKTSEDDQPDYILQRINQNVFPPVAEMMANIEKVTRHIIKKRKKHGSEEMLEIITTKSDKSYYTDQKGNYWRMYRNISPGISYDILPNNRIAYEAGKAFGQFIRDLRDLPADEIFPVIPHFHSMEMRFGQFKSALEADPVNRTARAKEEIGFVFSHISDMMVIPKLENEGKLPVRITHNDTKINNLLFDKNDKAVCVIDLDTVMPGLSLYDFGDTIRTAANTAGEDEPDTGKIQFNLPVFQACAEGFLEKTISFLTPAEVDLLPLSAQYMTFIMGLRFLTDYISGDTYFATSYNNHNLVRCRAQIRLMRLMIDKYQDSRDIILQTAEKYQIQQRRR